MENRKRLVDVNALKRLTCEWCNKARPEEPCEPSDCAIMMFYDGQPTVDAVEVVHGRWIFGNTLGHAWMKCSECLKSQAPNGCFTYCPNCGAKMDGENDAL